MLRIHGCAARNASRRLRIRPQEREIRARRGRGRLRPDAHHSDGPGAGRCDRRVGHERRDAAARKRLSAAPRGARRAGRVLGQVAAQDRGGRPAVVHTRRGHALHRPDARRHTPAVHLHPGSQVGDHDPLGRPGAPRQGVLHHQRPRLVRARAHQTGGCFSRRRAQLAHGEARYPCPAQGADTVYAAMAMGRQPGNPAEPRD